MKCLLSTEDEENTSWDENGYKCFPSNQTEISFSRLYLQLAGNKTVW